VTVVVSKEMEYGKLPSVAIVVHEPPPAGLCSKATELRPERPCQT
jgi:hypothetical protein